MMNTRFKEIRSPEDVLGVVREEVVSTEMNISKCQKSTTAIDLGIFTHL